MSSRYVRLEDKPHRYRVLETCPVRGVLVDAPEAPVWLPEAMVREDPPWTPPLAGEERVPRGSAPDWWRWWWQR
jgi:hypothetical protein